MLPLEMFLTGHMYLKSIGYFRRFPLDYHQDGFQLTLDLGVVWRVVTLGDVYFVMLVVIILIRPSKG